MQLAGPARATEAEILAATTKATLAGLRIPELVPLARKLSGASTGWSGAARVARAYRAGVGARLILEDEACKIESPPVSGLRNCYYIVLRAPGHPEGLWTRQCRIYVAAVADKNSQTSSFARESASHAYLLGARRAWPVFQE